MNPSELLWLVDDADHELGAIDRAEAHATGALHRAVHVLLHVDDGRLILQKRAGNRPMNPGRWTGTASGHVKQYVTYDEAALEELSEETSFVSVSLVPVGKCRAEAHNSPSGEVCRVWATVYRGLEPVPIEALVPQTDEVVRFEAFSLAAIAAAIDGSAELKDSGGEVVEFADNFPAIIELLLRLPHNG